MSFSRPILLSSYHSQADPIWLDGIFKGLKYKQFYWTESQDSTFLIQAKAAKF
jgi:hypothetical protein